MKWIRLVVGPAVGVLAMVLASTASAATVTASEGPLFKTPGRNYATATVEARADEANRLSITLAGEPGRYFLRVDDVAEPIKAATGSSANAGATGSTAVLSAGCRGGNRRSVVLRCGPPERH